ncbi:MAG: prepilin peptidase [Candidatus Kaelpia aquatica]|nr:prepilin peptidase [Candidatus Kaelpia aquatica]
MTLLIFFLGASLGSFLNVCILRLPREESVVQPPSHCPKCKHKIRWFDNIPIFSFLVLRAKCRYCRVKISMQYPVVELISGLVMLYFYSVYGISITAFIFSFFLYGLIVATFSDFQTRLIPDEVSLGLLPIGLMFSFFNPVLDSVYSSNPLVASFLGAVVGSLMIYLTGVLGKIAFKKEAMGFGDVKFMAMIGAFLGWKLIILNYFIAPFFALGYGLYRKIKYKDNYLPYGPFLAIAAIFVFIFYDKLLEIFFYL